MTDPENDLMDTLALHHDMCEKLSRIRCDIEVQPRSPNCQKCDTLIETRKGYYPMRFFNKMMNKSDPRTLCSHDADMYVVERSMCKRCTLGEGTVISIQERDKYCLICRSKRITNASVHCLCKQCSDLTVMQMIQTGMRAVGMMGVEKKHDVDSPTINEYAFTWNVRGRVFKFIIKGAGDLEVLEHPSAPAPAPASAPASAPQTQSRNTDKSNIAKYQQLGARDRKKTHKCGDLSALPENVRLNSTRNYMITINVSDKSVYTIPQRIDILRSYVILGIRRFEALPPNNVWSLFGAAPEMSSEVKQLHHPPDSEVNGADWEYMSDPFGTIVNKIPIPSTNKIRVSAPQPFAHMRRDRINHEPYQASILGTNWPQPLRAENVK